MTALLRFRKVALERGGRLLFEDMDVHLAVGDALLVTGPNGSGKSSLIRLAAGLLEPTRGTVERAEAALADDQVALDRELPIRRALSFWGGAIDDGLEAVGLHPLSGVPVRLLSAGQAKRASLARVAASAAPLWLLDEPANGLDRDSLQRLGGLIDRHRSAGGAVLAASHVPLPGKWRNLELAW